MTTSRHWVSPELKQIANQQLSHLASRPADGPPQLVTTVRSEALQNLQLRATVEGHSFIADEAMDKGGHDAGPAPLRYFLAGLMMCHQVWFIKGASRRDVTLSSLSGEISAYSGALPSPAGDEGRVLSRIEYSVHVTSDADGDTIETITDEAMHLCPAFATILRATAVDVSLTHAGEPVRELGYGIRSP